MFLTGGGEPAQGARPAARPGVRGARSTSPRPARDRRDRRRAHARAPRGLPVGVPAGAAAMTFSIAALDPANGDLGSPSPRSSPRPAPRCRGRARASGAIATQAAANTTYGPRGLSLLEGGMDAADVVDALVTADDGRDERQVGIVDARGARRDVHRVRVLRLGGRRHRRRVRGAGQHPGGRGGRRGDGRGVRGHARAICATGSSRRSRPGMRPAATDGAGSRPRCSSCAPAAATRGSTTATSTCGSTTIRTRQPSSRACSGCGTTRCSSATTTPWRRPPSCVAQLQADLAAVGYLDPGGGLDGTYDAATRAALTDWAGWENLEMRLREDDLVSEHLAAGAPARRRRGSVREQPDAAWRPRGRARSARTHPAHHDARRSDPSSPVERAAASPAAGLRQVGGRSRRRAVAVARGRRIGERRGRVGPGAERDRVDGDADRGGQREDDQVRHRASLPPRRRPGPASGPASAHAARSMVADATRDASPPPGSSRGLVGAGSSS